MPNMRIGFLPQEPRLDAGQTVKEAVEQGLSDVLEAKQKLEEIYAAYADPDADFDRLAAEQAKYEAVIAASGAGSDVQMEIAADALDLARRMDALGVRTLIHTDIGTDGMLTGPNFPAQEAMLSAGRFGVIASGGVSRREDVVRLAELARRHANLDGVIVGKALYEKRVSLPDLLSLAR